MSTEAMSNPSQSESMGGVEGRQRASDALRESAIKLRRRADGLEDIANALERCTPSGIPDGGEGHPHIGVGSAAEIALWEWAVSIHFR